MKRSDRDQLQRLIWLMAHRPDESVTAERFEEATQAIRKWDSRYYCNFLVVSWLRGIVAFMKEDERRGGYFGVLKKPKLEPDELEDYNLSRRLSYRGGHLEFY